MLEIESKDTSLEKDANKLQDKLNKAKHRRKLIIIAIVIAIMIVTFLYLIGYIIYSSPNY